MSNEHIGGRDLIEAVCAILGRFADPKRMQGVVGVIGDTGVRCQGSRTKPLHLLFTFHTPDDLTVQIRFDMGQANREYIDNMMEGLIADLKARREERERERFPTLILPGAVAGGMR